MNVSSLKFKIYFRFAIIALMLVVVAVVAFVGISKLKREQGRLQKINDLMSSVQDMNIDVNEIRIRVDRFVNSGRATLVEDIHDLGEAIYADIENVKSNVDIDDPSVSDNLEWMQSRLTAYLSQFDLVVTERKNREQLAKVQLPALVEKAGNEIQQLSSQIEKNQSGDTSRIAVAKCIAELSQAERSFLRYFENPNTVQVNQAVAHLGAASESAMLIQGVDQERQNVIESFDEVTQVGLQAIQSTRSYLFLRHVVMAGDQSEVTYYAKKIRELARKRKREIAKRTEQTATRSSWWTAAATSFAILLSLLTAGNLAYLILPPLTMLTNTFGRLSAGDSLDAIPGTNRKDEIGQLSHAASVFNGQNRKTRELLDQETRLTAELEKKAVELSYSNEELDRFAYVASHDLKSPLRGIRQLASWIEEDAGDSLPKESLVHIQKMQSRVTKMEELLENLLSYSRAGRSALVAENVDTVKMLESMQELMDNPRNIQIRIDDNLPRFKTFKAPFWQVWMNLLGNAIKHHDKESEGWIELAVVDENDDFYRFVVCDNGPGIEMANHERVFEMFQRVGAAETDGTGMGLAMVKKQVEHVGGIVILKSELGAGASFEFTWPVNAV